MSFPSLSISLKSSNDDFRFDTFDVYEPRPKRSFSARFTPYTKRRATSEIPTRRHDPILKRQVRVLPNTIIREGYKLTCDMKEFKPEEINVKVVENILSIEAKSGEIKEAHGFVERHFVSKYTFPKGSNLDKITSSVSVDGILTVKATFPKPIIETVENQEIMDIKDEPKMESKSG